MSSYKKLKKIFKEASLSSDIAGILHWDMSTMMPINSRGQRAEQLAYLSKLSHDKIASNEVAAYPAASTTDCSPLSAEANVI